MALLTPVPRSLSGTNPFDVPARADLLQPVRPDVSCYSETEYFAVVDRHRPGVGVFLHTGRVTEDPDLWWARMIAYLPDGRLAVDRSFGRPRDDRGPSTPVFGIRCEEPGSRWTLSFDGAAELTTREATATAPSGAGPALPVRIDIRCEAFTAIWDLGQACGVHGEISSDDSTWAARNMQQSLTATGTIAVAGETIEIDGFAHRDHSWGSRDLTDLGGDAFTVVIFPESRRVVHGLETWDRSGADTLRTYYVWEDGRFDLISDGSVPRASDNAGNPRTGLEFSLLRGDGTRVTMPGEVSAGATITSLNPNRSMMGSAAADTDPMWFNEDLVRYTWPDGEVGFGHSERGLRPGG